MAERAVTRTGAARAAPIAQSPARDTTTVRRGGRAAPTGPPLLRLVSTADVAAVKGHAPSLDALIATPGHGEPLSQPVRRKLESSLRVDLSPVRVHTDVRTRSIVAGLGARAFAWGRRIFLATGEEAGDVRLMAHEVAHVVQQRAAPRLQMLGGATSDALEREAHTVSDAVASGERATVVGRTSPQPQFGFGDWVKKGVSAVGSAVTAVTDAVGDVAGAALNFIKDRARIIPGYDMLGFILGRDPITQQAVPRNAVNLIKAVMGLWPGGSLIFDALQAHGIIEKVGAWLDPKLETLKSIVGGIRKALDQFISTLGLKDLANLGGAWDRAKRIFSEPIDRATAFVKTLATEVLGFIRDAILMPVAKLAENTRGYDLLKAVLGKDPITGKPVPQDATTLIGGFLKLIGEDAMFENMKRADAIPRAWAWFNKALAEVKVFVREIPPTFIAALKALDVADMILIPRAFIKLGKVFGGVAVRFITWAGTTIWNLLEIIFDVVSPGALDYIKKTGAALKSILKNPLPFVGNLVKAAKLGFQNFADRIGTHFKAALFDWLLGALPGVYIPKAFELGEIVKFVFSVLGLSWANIRGKLVKVMGETVVAAMETGFDIVVTLVKEGPAAAWDKIKDELDKLKGMVIDGIIDLIVDTLVKKAVPKLIALFIPGAGFISAILSIYETIMVFVDKIAKIVEVVKGFIDSIVNIANGVIDAAANKVEKTLANLMSLAISFLAGFLGFGKVADKIMGVINKVRSIVDKGIDKLIAWIVKMAKSLFAKAKSAVSNWWKQKQTFEADGETRTLYFEGEEDKAEPYIKSSPGRPILQYLEKEVKVPKTDPKLVEAKQIARDLVKRRPSNKTVEQWSAEKIALYNKLAPLLKALGGTAAVPPSVVTYSGLETGVGGIKMTAKILSKEHQKGTTPTEKWPLWEALDPLIGGSPHYVRGHLLNENVGGKGQMFNLTPITTSANGLHKNRIEADVKKWVIEKKKVVFYEVEAKYGSIRKKGAKQLALEADEKSEKSKTPPGKLKPKDAKLLLALDAERKLASKLLFRAYVLHQKAGAGDNWTKDPSPPAGFKPIDDSVDNA